MIQKKSRLLTNKIGILLPRAISRADHGVLTRKHFDTVESSKIVMKMMRKSASGCEKNVQIGSHDGCQIW